jgi:hypothetical protein
MSDDSTEGLIRDKFRVKKWRVKKWEGQPVFFRVNIRIKIIIIIILKLNLKIDARQDLSYRSV